MPLVVHFKKPGDWRDSVNIHYWDTGPGVNIHYWDTGPAIPQTAWPGVPMTAEGDDWFSHAFETAETIQRRGRPANRQLAARSARLVLPQQPVV